MKGTRAFLAQSTVVLFGIVLPPTIGSSKPVIVGGWIVALLSLLALALLVYRDRPSAGGIASSAQEELQRSLLHLRGELSTITLTIASARESAHWWDVRFSGLPANEWHASRDLIGKQAPALYEQLIPLYIEADQLNKTANAAAATHGPAGALNSTAAERLDAMSSNLDLAREELRSRNPAADPKPPIKHPYLTLGAAFAVTAIASAATALLAPSLWDSDPGPKKLVSNPLPRTGFPHGTGIRHSDYPNGFHAAGVPTPTFNSYLDNTDGSPNDERHFLAARVIRPLRVPASGFEVGLLDVRPGDTIEVSTFIRNDADPAGNENGGGPAVAHNTRVSTAWNRKSAEVLSLASFIFAENAVPDLTHRELHTISANLELRSQTRAPIRLKYVPDSARYLQNQPGGARVPGLKGRYKIWTLNPVQQWLFFTGYKRGIHNNTEIDAASGLPIGSDDSYRRSSLLGSRIDDRKDFYGGSGYFGYIVYSARVLAVAKSRRQA